MSGIRERKGISERKQSRRDEPCEGERISGEETRCSRYKFSCLCGAGVVLVTVVILVAWPSPIDPSDVRLPAHPHFASTNSSPVLSDADLWFENEIMGPEGFAMDENGNIYTGLADGRIIRFKDRRSFATVARTGAPPYDGCGSLVQEPRCGRPLGMQFDPQNPTHLYVVDAYHGILRLDTQSGRMETIVDTSLSPGNEKVEPPCKLVNDLVVLGNGSIFFTDSSFKYGRNQVTYEVLDGGANGRLFHFNMADKSLRVVAGGLHFPNGLCLSNDNEFLLVAETTRARILRIPLSGGETGRPRTFTGSLPGLPDNVSPSNSGGYWVGIAASRNRGRLDKLYNSKRLRSFMAKLSDWLDFGSLLREESMIVELDANGEIRRVLHDASAPLRIDSVSEVLAAGRDLYLGSYQAPHVAVLRL